MIHKMITVLVTLLLMALLPPVIALTWWTWHRPDPIKIIERVAYYKKGRLFTSVTMVAHDLCIFTTEPQIINDRVVVLPPSDPRQMTQLGEITRNQIFIIDLDKPGPHEFAVHLSRYSRAG